MPHILSTTEEMQQFITKAIADSINKLLPLIELKSIATDKEIYNLIEAAKYLNLSPHTLRKKIVENKISYIQDQRVLQFRKIHLDKYLDDHTIKNEKKL